MRVGVSRCVSRPQCLLPLLSPLTPTPCSFISLDELLDQLPKNSTSAGAGEPGRCAIRLSLSLPFFWGLSVTLALTLFTRHTRCRG